MKRHVRKAFCSVVFSIFFLLNGPIFSQNIPKVSPLKNKPSKILLVLTGISKIPNSERETGFWAEEYVIPCEIFKSAGFNVVAASIKGGKVPMDPSSIDPKVVGEKPSKELLQGLERNKEFSNSVPLSKLRIESFSAIFVVGGHGVMWDLTGSKELQGLFQLAVKNNLLIAAVCHGPGALIRTQLPNGKLFLEGKNVTGFSAKEEEMAGMSKVVPYCLEAELQKETQGHYSKANEPWASFSVVDGNLITGQNPASSAETAKNVVKRLKFVLSQKE